MQGAAQTNNQTPVEWITYGRIGGKYGLTVPAVKKLFREAGWLEGHRPTAQALSSGVAATRPVSGSYCDGRQVIWNVAAVAGLMADRHVEELDHLTKHLHISNRYQAVERLEAAAAGLGRLIGRDPGAGAPPYGDELDEHLGWMLYESGLLLTVIEEGREFRAAAREHLDPLLRAASLLRGADARLVDHWGRVIENALAWVDRFQKRGRRRRAAREPGRAEYQEALGLIARREYRRALGLLESAQSANPRHPAIFEAKGRALTALGRDEEALTAFRAGNALAGDRSEDCWLGEGRALTYLGRFDEARAALLTAVRLCEEARAEGGDPAIVLDTQVTALCLLGLNDVKRGDWERAYDSFARALEFEPDYEIALFHAGRTAVLLGRYRAAVIHLSRTVERSANDAAFGTHALVLLGRAYFNLGDLTSARKFFEAAVSKAGARAEAHVLLALTLERQGHADAAVRHLGHALALDPRSAWALGEARRMLAAAAAAPAAVDSGPAADEWRDDEFWPDVIGYDAHDVVEG